MEDYRKDVLGNNEGVGYSEAGIVDATGVSSRCFFWLHGG